MARQRTFLVERYIPQLNQEAAANLAQRLAMAAAALTREGRQVEWLGSTALPEEDTCLCTFRAHHAADVAHLNERAHAPFDRIIETLQLEPWGSPGPGAI